jgi:predicted ester cyclase
MVLPILLWFSCQDKQTKEDLIRYQQTEAKEISNIELTKEMFKLMNEQGLEAAKNQFSSDYKHHIRFSDEPIVFDDMIPLEKPFFSAFPDAKHNIENIFAADDYVVVQYRMTGTHSGTFMGKEPTGSKINYNAIGIFKMADGKFIEGWVVGDDLTLMTQLGFKLK